MQGSTNFTAGNTLNATQGRDLRRFTFTDGLTWQKGTHRFRFGTELEFAPGTGFWGYCDPACTSVFSIESVRGLVPAQFLPLKHAIDLARPLMLGRIPDQVLLHVAVLLFYAALAYYVALVLTRRRLLK